MISLSEITDYFYIDFKFLQQSLFRVKVNDNYLLIMRLKKKYIKKKANKPIARKIELWIKPWDTNKLVIYDRIVINRIPHKPNSPRESLIYKSLEDKYPKPIIENKIIK